MQFVSKNVQRHLRIDTIKHMYKIAIVEDEWECIESLECSIKKYSRHHKVDFEISSFKNGRLFLESNYGSYDIVFMDVDMPNLNGFETAKKMRELNKSAVLIFVTFLAKYAARGYEVDAMDYIVKPLEYEALSIRMDKAIQKCRFNDVDYISLPIKGGEIRIALNSLKYIEINAHQINYHIDNECYSFYGTLKKLESILPKGLFVRCNNCYLVNLRRVTRIGDEEIYLGDECLKMSRTRKKQFLQSFHEQMLGVR